MIRKKTCSGFKCLLAFLFITGCSLKELTQIKPDIKNGGRAVAVSVDPVDDNNILVASASGGLFLSTDRGKGWDQVSRSSTFWFNDVLFLPSNPRIAFAAAKTDTKVLSGGGIYISRNGGNANWIKIDIAFECNNSLNAYCLSYEAAKNRVWVGTSCGLAYSDNNGSSWSIILNNIAIYDLTTPSADHIIFSDGENIHVSNDEGKNWSVSVDGLPSSRYNYAQSQIAVSPFNDQHIFWVFNTISPGFPSVVYYSNDNGKTWTNKIIEEVHDGFIPRPPFIAASKSMNGLPNMIDLYFGGGYVYLKRITILDNLSSAVTSVKEVQKEHVDITDIGFANDKKTPLILTGDGGLNIYSSQIEKDSFFLAGSGPNGYNALQVNEVAGQLHQNKKGVDLYFITQDNYFWPSTNNGLTWNTWDCCEGYFLNIPRNYYDENKTRITAYVGGNYSTKIYKKLLSGKQLFQNDAEALGDESFSPRLISPGRYLQRTLPPSNWLSSFKLTNNNGLSWSPLFKLKEGAVGNLFKFSEQFPIPQQVFIPYQKNWEPMDMDHKYGLKRVAGISAVGTPVISDITGFGSIGKYTGTPVYFSYGVNPYNANELIIPDIESRSIKLTYDGGISWSENDFLKQLVTENGNLKFSGKLHIEEKYFSQITAIEYNPDCPNYILAGTTQAGLFSSSDNGHTWEKVKGSEQIPNITSIFFGAKVKGKQEAFISSYGRGIWKMRCKCSQLLVKNNFPPIEFLRNYPSPLLYQDNTFTPLESLNVTSECTTCAFFLAKDGEILSYKITDSTGQLNEIVMDKGSLSGYTIKKEKTKTPFELKYSQDKLNVINAQNQSEDIRQFHDWLVKTNKKIKGIYMEGNIFKGFLLSNTDIEEDSMPTEKSLEPGLAIVGYDSEEDKTKQIIIIGRGFDSELPLEILIDNKIYTNEKKLQFFEKGGFKLIVPSAPQLGTHTIQVIQHNANRIIKGSISYIVNPG